MQPFGRTGQDAQYSAVTGTSEADARVRAAVPKAAPDARGRRSAGGYALPMASHGAGAESIEHMGLVEPLDVSAVVHQAGAICLLKASGLICPSG